jgi:hypothetical protein
LKSWTGPVVFATAEFASGHRTAPHRFQKVNQILRLAVLAAQVDVRNHDSIVHGGSPVRRGCEHSVTPLLAGKAEELRCEL